MNGVTEEGGRIAVAVVDSLKSNPGLLVLVLLQAATLLLIHFAVNGGQDRMQAREIAMIERCFSIDRIKP